MMTILREELATLQRQIRDLEQSLQTRYSRTPSTYEAPSSHKPSADRITNSQPSSGSDNTRSESTRDTPLAANIDISRDDVNDYYETQPTLSNYKQDNEDNYSKANERREEPNTLNKTEIVNEVNSRYIDDQSQPELLQKDTMSHVVKPHENDTNMQEDNTTQEEIGTVNEYVTSSKELVNENDVKDNEQYKEENHSMAVEPENIQYDDQNYNNTYDPNYEQPQYTENYENYEQYPQQYTDPNTQYEGQYDNYDTGGHYDQQMEQSYDDTQHNQEHISQHPDTTPATQNKTDENNTSNDPVTSQS